MVKEIVTFGDTKIAKNKFYPHKSTFFYKDIDIEEI